MPADPRDPLDLHPATGRIAEGADARRRIAALERTRHDLGWIEGWHLVGAVGEPAFVNSWGNYGAPESPLRFYKDDSGNVFIAGALVRSAGVAATVFTLPLGYRPQWAHMAMPVAGGQQVSVYADGTVQMDSGTITNGTPYRIVVPPIRALIL